MEMRLGENTVCGGAPHTHTRPPPTFSVRPLVCEGMRAASASSALRSALRASSRSSSACVRPSMSWGRGRGGGGGGGAWQGGSAEHTWQGLLRGHLQGPHSCVRLPGLTCMGRACRLPASSRVLRCQQAMARNHRNIHNDDGTVAERQPACPCAPAAWPRWQKGCWMTQGWPAPGPPAAQPGSLLRLAGRRRCWCWQGCHGWRGRAGTADARAPGAAGPKAVRRAMQRRGCQRRRRQWRRAVAPATPAGWLEGCARSWAGCLDSCLLCCTPHTPGR